MSKLTQLPASASLDPSAKLLPDPCLTANLYCNRRLDLTAREVLGALSADLASPGVSPESFLWFARYGKCGEHLKVRVHGPGSTTEVARASLETAARGFFASPASDPDPDVWVSKSAIPPIDPEDEYEGDYPNKYLLWTHYRRSPIVFGTEVYLDDDVHVDHFCRCQAAVTSIALEMLLPKFGEPAFPKHRQSVYIKVLLTAISVLGLSATETATYLAYHRDWLLRALVRNVTPLGSTTESLLEEIQLRSSSSDLRPLTDHVEYALAGAKSSPSESCPAFHRELSAFYEYVSTYRGKERFDQDPFTRDFAFLPIFKVLHFAANQFGFRLSHEAYVFNLLVQATTPLCPQGTDVERCL
jgi:hypothetical protein